ncbi:tRNA ligase class II [Ancylostoma ceylanicum]|uniref:tRNA ligase class II n=1 Tax=Ancylostoma ceylanicum TaxID=53326 RepID=A0A0D6LTC1_9BILA|nr:tRNA ligase class II [Ancylostoma ceylanicum]
MIYVRVGSAVSVMGRWQHSLGSQQEKELLANACQVLATDVESRGYIHIDTPVFTTNDCEGAGETFSVAENLADLMAVPEDFLRFCIRYLLNTPDVIKDFESLGAFSTKDHPAVLRSIVDGPPFPRLTFADALKLLSDKNQRVSGRGLSKLNEAFLVEYHNSPVFITHFPLDQKPFYMLRSPSGETTESFDLLCPGVCELAGGSIREPSAERLRERNPSVDWYAEIRERGKPISAGFGMGFERLLQLLLGVQNIKDTIPFPSRNSELNVDLAMPSKNTRASKKRDASSTSHKVADSDASADKLSTEPIYKNECAMDLIQSIIRRNKDPEINKMLAVLADKVSADFKEQLEEDKRSRSVVVSGLPESGNGTHATESLEDLEIPITISKHYTPEDDVKARLTLIRDLNVKVVDGDVALIRVESSSEKFVTTVLPFITLISRSIRACEKFLIRYRRTELYSLLRHAEPGVEKNATLKALNSVSGKLNC